MLAAVLMAGLFSGTALAENVPTSAAGKEALTLLTRGISFRMVAGQGQVPAYAAYLKQQLVAAGFPEADVAFTPVAKLVS
jgi:hypothetical protein